MTSKVIIRIGEKSEQVDKENIFERGTYRFAKDLSVVFAQTGIYYLIITNEDLINDLYDATAETEHTNDFSEADSIIESTIKHYMVNSFDDFNSRVEKAVKTAHGIGVKKMASKIPTSKRSKRRTNTLVA